MKPKVKWIEWDKNVIRHKGRGCLFMHVCMCVCVCVEADESFWVPRMKENQTRNAAVFYVRILCLENTYHRRTELLYPYIVFKNHTSAEERSLFSKERHSSRMAQRF